jgi:hypothetical protein
MGKIQLQSAYGGPGMVITEKDPYFVHNSHNSHVHPCSLYAEIGRDFEIYTDESKYRLSVMTASDGNEN